ncbi:M24 family metallopeptidase [Saccharopolyspora gloriosae]|uniref:M24 family metallopeptidase n=1 Tax=Saccharopolyspora gloriosae TaxID=455344 RepID=UPI001FB57103|nr:M24 family metallopeptidase [Saccharopolyspora gloriosae]
MLHLTADDALVKQHYGLDARRSLLFSAIRLDSHPLVSPLIAERGGERTLLVRQQEQGNALSAGVPKEQIRFYAPWVTIDPRVVAGIPVAGSLTELVAELADDGRVHLAANVVLAHHRAFAASGALEVTVDAQPPTPVVAHEVDTTAVLARFAEWRAGGAQVARRLIDGVEHLDGLAAELPDGEDTRFTALTALAREHGLDAVLLAATPNHTEVTGQGRPENAVAVWLPGAERLVVLAPEGTSGLPGTPIGRHASFGAAVTELSPGGRIGVEEEFIGIGFAQELEQAGGELIGISAALGHWRDVRDREDLAFQIIASRTSVFAIEAALAWAERGIEDGREFTELDIYAVYLDKIVEFRDENDIPFGVEPYFTNLHSSNRMLFPGPPVDFPINRDTTCIQLDAGVRVVAGGVTVATSDMARSLPRTEGAKEAYAFFFDVVRDGIIGQLRPGVVCQDVHEGTLKYLAPHLDRMRQIGVLGTEVDFNTEYRKRNVGHLMGKQESFANELRPGYEHVLQVGSFGAAEIPWRYDNVAIGTEDLWYVGRDRTYIVSQW